MNQYLLDTNVPSELTRPQPEQSLDRWLRQNDPSNLFLSAISIVEIVKGIARMPNGSRRDTLEAWLHQTLWPWFDGRILPVTAEIAERLGRLSATQQAQGRTLALADGLIAATAIEHGLTLVTRNTKDFEHLNLPLLNPWHL